MRKNKMVELFPQRREMKKTLKAKQKDLQKLTKEVYELEDNLYDLDGVTLFDNFPLRVVSNDDSDVDIFSACDEVERQAHVELRSENQWLAFGSDPRKEGFTEHSLGEFRTRSAAVKAASLYVSNGRAESKAVKASK